MSTVDPEEGPDPDLMASIWYFQEKLDEARAVFLSYESQLLEGLRKLESVDQDIVSICKACTEPFLVSTALKEGRFRHLPFEEIFRKVKLIYTQIKKDQ